MMGRCPEDGQTVFFEASEDEAVNFFLQVKFKSSVYVCRVAHVCASVYAIYTPARSDDLQNVAQEASLLFHESYFHVVSDEPNFSIWKVGCDVLGDLPEGRKGRRLLKEIQSQTFQRSTETVGEDIWKILSDFAWSQSWKHEEYLHERHA